MNWHASLVLPSSLGKDLLGDFLRCDGRLYTVIEHRKCFKSQYTKCLALRVEHQFSCLLGTCVSLYTRDTFVARSTTWCWTVCFKFSWFSWLICTEGLLRALKQILYSMVEPYRSHCMHENWSWDSLDYKKSIDIFWGSEKYCYIQFSIYVQFYTIKEIL